MNKLILVVSIVVLGFSSYSFATDEGDAKVELGSQGGTGMFCNIEEAEVCVVARTEDDCTKLGGEKVDACPMSEDDVKAE